MVQQQQSELLKIVQTQKMKQDEQIQSFQMMFLQQQQQQSKIMMSLLDSQVRKILCFETFLLFFFRK